MNFRKASLAFLFLAGLAWTEAGAAMNARHSHTTTLLPDGNLLITGGVTDAANTKTSNVQIYNMSSNQFEAWSGNLVTARSSHTATLMSDGRVLVAGGFDTAGNPLASMEICDPIAKTCAATTAMSTPRGGHTATLLTTGPRAGQVLLCGGQNGADQASITGACDAFNPSGAAVSQAGAIVSPRMGHAAVLLPNGKVFVTGGRRRNATDTAWLYQPMNELYDPVLDVWTPVSALLQGRIDHSATVLNNGLVLIAGGYNAANVLSCRAGGTLNTDECWYIDRAVAGDAGAINQNAGNQGLLDGAEVFDSKGARAVLAEGSFGVAPYRVRQHSALLLPDGTWDMSGGYGNIFPTFFNYTPTLTTDSVVYLNKTGDRTATILSTSTIRFLLDLDLSRKVSGRLVDSDAFFSLPTAGKASIATDNVSLYLPRSTAALDGLPVGTLIGDGYLPGQFYNTVQLTAPQGAASFASQSLSSGDAPNLTKVQSSVFTLAGPLYPEDKDKIITGNMTAWVSITLPDIYRGIKGKAYILSGQITDPGGIYNITLEQFGNGDVDVFEPTSCDADTNSCLYITTVAFTGTQGKISNLTALSDGTTVYSPLDAANDDIALSLKLDYTADEIHMLDREPTYNFTTSSVVVRGMVMASRLGYIPAQNKWKDLADLDVSPTLTYPVFNHTSVMTPAADSVVLGGRNCEASPAADCLRAAPVFAPTSAYKVFIPVLHNPDGSVKWIQGSPLNSRRGFHTSTLLSDGSILTCGGTDGASQLDSCERLDPATRKWAFTGAMTSPRSNHTATLLPNGNVLVTGGVTPSSSAVATAEIYYPDAGRWVPTSAMASPRANHTATLLPDGNVLVAGGSTISTYSATAEIYIASAAYWQQTGSMATPRAQHTATLLKSGNVLMAGGVNGFGAVPETEIYDYLNKTFSAGPDLNTPRYEHTATLLRDGKVLVIGGTNNSTSLLTSEIYDGASWAYPLDPSGSSALLNLNRSGHRSVLLPNGKVMVTGGEAPGVAQAYAESFDPDFRSYSEQGETDARSHHTTILTPDNYLVDIGGWDGGKYLDTTELAYFSYGPDIEGLASATTRQMVISTATTYFDRGMPITLTSDATNFHGITEASGGGAGPINSSFSNPRVYMQQIDNPSGFMIDLSTRIYSWYGGPNASWEKTLSSITVITPSLPGELPHGWYHMRVAGSGMFSEGRTVQVTVPRPSGVPTAPSGLVLGVSSITWSWTSGTVPSADGYALYSSSDSVFITTAAFVSPASYTQTALQPNTEISVKVNATNIGGGGAFAQSATYYTLAAAPAGLSITGASFNTATLQWDSSNNSAATAYEVSMCAGSDFGNPLLISTPVPFVPAYTSTSTTITRLSANTMYYFRVRARNGAAVPTAFTPSVSTITVAAVNNLTGTALSTASINWSWSASSGADYYELFDVTAGTDAAVLVGSTTDTSLNQTGLDPNAPYQVGVHAVKTNPGFGPIFGPMNYAGPVYTLAVTPSPDPINPFTEVSTGSFTANWLNNANSTSTVYTILISTSSSFAANATSSATTTADTLAVNGLSANLAYYVKVIARNGDGIPSEEASLGYVYTWARPPLSVTPASVEMSGVTLTWDQNGNSPATIYEVRGTTVSPAFTDSVLTYLPFSALSTAASYKIGGLLTSTTYYFQVTACNGEGVLYGCTGSRISARTPAVPAAYTLPGPGGAPSGSIGGTALPDALTTLHGWLPNTREVTLTVPAGAFPAETAIAVSSSATGACGGYTVCGRTVEVAIYSQDGAQPQVPVTLDLGYECTIPDTSKLVLARYNPVSGQCLPLETTINPSTRKITATLNHFSVFQLMVRNAASSLNDVQIYPNPFRPNRGQGFVTITNMPAGAEVRVYTLSGNKVWEGTAGSTGILIWRGVNKYGYLVASGVYLAVIDSSAGKKVFKLAVER